MNTRLRYPFPEPPAPLQTILVAPGVHWLRLPLPFALDHINLWLLEDDNGEWTLVDCGIGLDDVKALWRRLFDEVLAGKPLKRIIVTHYHPDHIGLADWLSQHFAAPVLMTAGEHAMACSIHRRNGDESGERIAELFLAHGLDAERAEQLRRRGNPYRKVVSAIPTPAQILHDGDRLRIGAEEWQVVVGRGHAPEHACLYCERLGVLISGDQILPRISSNVSFRPGEEGANPLADFLDSLDKLMSLPARTRVLPSHNLVFEGLHERAQELKAHHAEQLAKLEAACREPRAAADVLAVMFERELDTHSLLFAMGEAIAHLHYLELAGRLERERGADGVNRYCQVAAVPE
ncbi:hypothetical protein CAI21_01735 [Alkalilimnicola ehrlichii]|uniref:Metallo-beta-lactamase domain-containing protein n=1 Tax=Alkalilimnicola ehrlichii TaxID=351052 RepID=A0A3E0X133_9GAMM|nr:MBL fold metallo-hydrolase [Alkalilimnicola ehrlichii]RFA31367.1 hypothetical protein CAI21_01735 [Alkalilimnicola ehrlichii]RFA39359.1 hypothetical protein CAL65_00670 [Alkalilimnicola ehrlichii]